MAPKLPVLAGLLFWGIALVQPAPAQWSTNRTAVPVLPPPVGSPQPAAGGDRQTVAPPGTERRAGEKYTFSPGDRISLRVLESRDEPVSLIVSPTGEIEAPLLGRRLVIGKTIPQMEAEFKTEYEKDYYYTATVQLAVQEINAVPVDKVIRRVYVTGQVSQQGPQEFPSNETFTVSKAILRAGGFGSFANGRKVMIVRKGESKKEEKIIVDVMSILEDGKVENDVELKPDDLIIVPEKLINF